MGGVFQNRNAEGRLSLFCKDVQINKWQLAIGFNVLILGALFYYFYRSTGHIYFIGFWGGTSQPHFTLSPLFTKVSNSLPTFIHVFAFTFITAALVAGTPKNYLIVTLSWFTVDVLLEIGQGFGQIMIRIIPERFSNIPFLENTGNYFINGRFDYLDLLSITIGSLAAYFILRLTNKREEKHDEETTGVR